MLDGVMSSKHAVCPFKDVKHITCQLCNKVEKFNNA